MGETDDVGICTGERAAASKTRKGCTIKFEDLIPEQREKARA